MLAVNLRAVFFVLQATAKRMRHQSPISGSELRGKLIQTASIAAYRGGLANMAHYAASKAGVVSITRTAAQVLAAYRITSNCICPGAVDTPMCGGRSTPSGLRLKAGRPVKPGSGEPHLSRLAGPKPLRTWLAWLVFSRAVTLIT